MINYKDLDAELKEKYGKNIIERYQIYKELRNKITLDKLEPEEISVFCDGIYQLMQECLGKEKPNSIEITGFCALFRTVSGKTSYKEIIEKLGTESGFAELKSIYKSKSVPYEMLYLAARTKYGFSFIENMDIYIELRRVIMHEEFNKDELNELLDAIRGAAQIVDMDLFTSRSFAHYLKNMRIPIKKLPSILTSQSKLTELEEEFWNKRERFSSINRLLNRIRRSIYLKYDSMPDFFRASGLDNNFISTMMNGCYPGVMNIIKVAYLTDTTMDFLANDKPYTLPGKRTPMEELMENGQYKASILKDRLDEYCLSQKMRLKDLLINCGLNPFTPLNWAKEKTGPSIETVITICKKENLNMDYLLGLTSEKDETFFFDVL